MNLIFMIVRVILIFHPFFMIGFNSIKKSSSRDLVGLVSWNLWRFQNSIFFESRVKVIGLVVQIIVRDYRGIIANVGKTLKVINRDPNFHKKFRWC